MPVLNSIAALQDQMTAWRRTLHQMPELEFDCHQTSAFVEARLRDMGIEQIHTGFAKTGLVALIDGREAGPTIALRADMDALPIAEATGAEYASQVAGKMHACGHDGHTTMLLGAAHYLAETRNFAGRVALIFQPAEEEGGGAGVMTQEGVLDRFDIREIYALHNAPGVPVGTFYTTPGPIMAAVDTYHINVKGRGGHAAMAYETADPIVATVSIAQAVQTVVTRNINALDSVVLSVNQIHTGSAENIVPETSYINGTVRSFDKEVQAIVQRRLQEICDGHAIAYGVEVDLTYDTHYPATINDPEKTQFACDVAAEIGPVIRDAEPTMGAEDFAYFLENRPGAYLNVGNGNTAGLHHPEYDFNDDCAPVGATFFARIAERALPLKG